MVFSNIAIAYGELGIESTGVEAFGLFLPKNQTKYTYSIDIITYINLTMDEEVRSNAYEIPQFI